MQNKKYRFRYAPSPTGLLHIGGARTAIFNWLYARSINGEFIIRVEDTDVERNIKDGEASQLNGLKWLGLDYDESPENPGKYAPYRQLERLDTYKKYADFLLEKGLAYKCFCTSDELEKEREAQKAAGIDNIHYSRKCIDKQKQDKPFAIRFKVPAGEVYEFSDLVRGDLSFQSSDIGDWVIVKNNGIPTYNFAVVVDDHLMDITHVLRGEEHLPNTPRQIMVYRALNWEVPVFGHMTLIVNAEKKKLSKRDPSIVQFIQQYLELGYLPEALFNFIALLGWSPKNNEEIMTIEEFVKEFDPKRLSKAPAFFDQDKLLYINKEYIKKLDLDDFTEMCMPHLVNSGIDINDFEHVKKLCSLFQERTAFGKQIVSFVEEFFNDNNSLDSECLDILKEESGKVVLLKFTEELNNIKIINEENIKEVIKKIQVETSIKGKTLFMPIRIATTFMLHGPDLNKSLEILGKKKVQARLKKIIKEIY